MNHTTDDRPGKVLLGILSTDVHTRASIVVAQALRDAGLEVVYLGFGLTPGGLVQAAVEEDPDVICISTHEGFHMKPSPRWSHCSSRRICASPSWPAATSRTTRSRS